MAYSVDGGETFLKYEKKPVVPHMRGGNRDPKVTSDGAVTLTEVAVRMLAR